MILHDNTSDIERLKQIKGFYNWKIVAATTGSVYQEKTEFKSQFRVLPPIEQANKDWIRTPDVKLGFFSNFKKENGESREKYISEKLGLECEYDSSIISRLCSETSLSVIFTQFQLEFNGTNNFFLVAKVTETFIMRVCIIHFAISALASSVSSLK